MERHIPFQSRWIYPMLARIKTCTTRSRPYGKPGDTFQVFGATFTILSIQKRFLGAISVFLYQEEGCSSPEEFRDIWRKLHPRLGFDPNYLRYVIHFRKELPPCSKSPQIDS